MERTISTDIKTVTVVRRYPVVTRKRDREEAGEVVDTKNDDEFVETKTTTVVTTLIARKRLDIKPMVPLRFMKPFLRPRNYGMLPVLAQSLRFKTRHVTVTLVADGRSPLMTLLRKIRETGKGFATDTVHLLFPWTAFCSFGVEAMVVASEGAGCVTADTLDVSLPFRVLMPIHQVDAPEVQLTVVFSRYKFPSSGKLAVTNQPSRFRLAIAVNNAVALSEPFVVKTKLDDDDSCLLNEDEFAVMAFGPAWSAATGHLVIGRHPFVIDFDDSVHGVTTGVIANWQQPSAQCRRKCQLCEEW